MKKSRNSAREPLPRCQFDKLTTLSQFISNTPPPAGAVIFAPLFEERKMLSPAPLLDQEENDGGKQEGNDTLSSIICSDDSLILVNTNLYQSFCSASSAERINFLFNQVPLNISKSQLSSLVVRLRTHLKVDPFSVLPYEMCARIATHLDADSMLLARCVSRRWRELVDPMEQLWRKHLDEDSIGGSSSSHFCSSPGEGRSFEKFFDHLLAERSMRFAWFHAPPLRIDVPCHNRAVITCLQILDSDSSFASASDDGSVLLWQISPPKVIFALLGHTGGVWCIHSIGNLLLSGSTDRTLRLWNIQTGLCVGILRGHSSTVRCASLVASPLTGAHSILAISGSRDATLRVWDLESMSTRFLLEGHTAAVRCIAVDGNILVSGSYDSTARIWEISTGHCLHVLIGHMAKIYSVAILDNMVATGAMDSNILLWDIKTGQCLSILEGIHLSAISYCIGMRGIIGSLSFLDSERLVSSSTDGSVRIWAIKMPGECIHRLRTDNAAAVAFLQANSTIIVAGSDRVLRMWETASGRHIRDLINDVDSIWRLAFNHNFCVVGCLKNGITTLSFLYFSWPSHGTIYRNNPKLM
ncbi:SCF ubiquitin ligase complex subunit cdc4 [Mitosporidium daphniae]